MKEFSRINYLEGKIKVPGDKSISHRAVIISALANGTSRADNFLSSDDCLRTIEAFRYMGAEINFENNIIKINGMGLGGFKKPGSDLYMGGSGTSMRLILGILAGQKFKATLCADHSLSGRPMKRVTLPLREMGARITGPDDANFPPLVIEGVDLRAIEYKMPVASAQVKSAILLAGLFARGKTVVTEPIVSRDHTERILKLFGADIRKEGLSVSVEGCPSLEARRFSIPGDISSAANFIVLGVLAKKAHLVIESVGLNPTRIGIINVLKRMGASIEVNIRGGEDFEPFGDIEVVSSELKATRITAEEVPLLIDELPLLMVAASFAEGITIIEGAQELRVKETDRINSMATNLKKMGAKIEVEKEVIKIEGGFSLKGTRIDSFGDHRTAMGMIVAGLVSPGKTEIDDVDCINKSFPSFLDILNTIIKR